MDKELLTEKRVRMDLVRILEARRGRLLAWRLFYIVPGVPLAVLLGFLFDSVWIGLLALCYTVYHAVCLASEQRRHSKLGCQLFGGLGGGALTVTRERLSEIAEESVFDHHRGLRHHHTVRSARFFEFASGKRWRVTAVGVPESRSAMPDALPAGGGCTAVLGDEFYLVTMTDDPEIGMLYSTLEFELGEELLPAPTSEEKKENEDQ